MLGGLAAAMEQGDNSRRGIGGVASILIVAALLALFFGFSKYMPVLHGPRLSVSARHLPYYAFCSFNRMLAAYLLALVFSIAYGMMAARGRMWERVMIPAIDIAQSVPVVGFFPAAVYFFVALAHGSRLGVEMAAVFLIFTSQAWNLALGVFESIRTIPDDSREVLEAFGASGWLRFRKLSLPACVPKLVYNSILSWVAGWYFLIACEIITAGPSTYRLPGLGSFLMEAANRGRNGEMVLGLLALLLIIVAMDLIVWQPLSVWAEKFRYEFTAGAEAERSLGMLHAIGLLGPSIYRVMRQVVRPLVVIVQGLLDAIPPLNPRSREGVEPRRAPGRIRDIDRVHGPFHLRDGSRARGACAGSDDAMAARGAADSGGDGSLDHPDGSRLCDFTRMDAAVRACRNQQSALQAMALADRRDRWLDAGDRPVPRDRGLRDSGDRRDESGVDSADPDRNAVVSAV